MMKQAEWLQELRKMRFEEAYSGWTERRLTQEEAACTVGKDVLTAWHYNCRLPRNVRRTVDADTSTESHPPDVSQGIDKTGQFYLLLTGIFHTSLRDNPTPLNPTPPLAAPSPSPGFPCWWHTTGAGSRWLRMLSRAPGPRRFLAAGVRIIARRR